MSKPKRRHFTPEKKAEILREHFVEKVPVSDLCEKHKIQPSVFYGWQKQLLENMTLALENGNTRRAGNAALEREQSKVDALEKKLVRKNEVIAEISQEVVDLKKSRGET